MSWLSKKISRYFNIAKKVSQDSDHPIFNIGCIVLYKNKIVSSGYSSIKSHPLQKEYNSFRQFDPSVDFNDYIHKHYLHAEVMAINNATRFIKDDEWPHVKLIIYRTTKDNDKQGMCRPCKACMEMINNKGIRNIYYTTPEGFNYEILNRA